MASARDRVLDAYETLLIRSGPAAATLDAVAAAAEVSKGGLLYHFGSKDALVAGLLERLRERSAADAEAIRTAPEGAVSYYLRTSAPGGGTPGGLTRTYLAVLRLADTTEAGQAVRDALAVVNDDALEALRAELDDPVLAFLAQLVGDGLYLRTLVGTPLPPGLDVGALMDRLRSYLPSDEGAETGGDPAERRAVR
ncbi:MAG TPA: TetR/AcrR family transcriptional regulator [Pseudonocardia sp.]|nr:TetR/AcrR family transcriptional regulator [Pseudonocardia sp.]